MKVKLLLVAIVLSTYSCVKKSLDVEKPTFDTPVTFSGQTADAMTLTWAAKDDLSKDEDLSYKVVYSMSDNISTEADAEANGTVLMDWTINTLTANMTSLNMVTTYYVTVLVRDEKSNTALSSGSSSTLCAGKTIFLASVPNGNFGGPSGADTVCTAQKPVGSTATYKALVVDFASRKACSFGTGTDDCKSTVTGRVNWVLGSNLTYCSSDFLKRVGTTNTNSYLTVPVSNSLSSTDGVFTGLNVNWGYSPSNCSDFASTTGLSTLGAPNGTVVSGTSSAFISNGSGACSAPGKIYCIEQ